MSKSIEKDDSIFSGKKVFRFCLSSVSAKPSTLLKFLSEPILILLETAIANEGTKEHPLDDLSMKIVAAPESFKGSISAREAAAAIETGIRRISGDIEVVRAPLSDGGEGFVEVITGSAGGRIRRKKVTGPLGIPVTARYGLIDGGATGIIETASAAGLSLVNMADRNPLLATSFGVGELIRSAILDGCRNVIIGAGGSATVDCGIGMLQALGVEFTDGCGEMIGRGGRELMKIRSVRTEPLRRLASGVRFTVAADVVTPLCGKRGAATVFGPQKGATPEMVSLLDRGLRHFAEVIEPQVREGMRDLAGGGAAGGLAAGAWAFLAAEVVSGIDLVIEKTGFVEKLSGCDLVITGEGRTDTQTISGKAPLGVARIAKVYGVPVVCLSGGLGPHIDELYGIGFDALFSLTDGPIDEAAATRNASRLLARAAENIARLFMRGYLSGCGRTGER